jgi:hypothetical protein
MYKRSRLIQTEPLVYPEENTQITVPVVSDIC